MSSVEVERKEQKRESIKVAKGIYRDKLSIVERKKELNLEDKKDKKRN